MYLHRDIHVHIYTSMYVYIYLHPHIHAYIHVHVLTLVYAYVRNYIVNVIHCVQIEGDGWATHILLFSLTT